MVGGCVGCSFFQIFLAGLLVDFVYLFISGFLKGPDMSIK